MSSVSTGNGYQDGTYKADRIINTRYILNWISLSDSYKKKFISERKKQGVKLGDGKVSNTGNDLDKLKELKKQNTKFKSRIKALKKKVKNDNDDGDDNDEPEDAGDQFGGKQSKKKSKKHLLLGLHYYVSWSFISYTLKLIVKWLNIIDVSSIIAINFSVQQVHTGQRRIISAATIC